MPYGVSGSATYSEPINNLVGMLSVLPDNNANEIAARDLRDVVSGLWDRTESLSQSVASASTFIYNNSSPTPIAVGGYVAGSTFNDVGLKQLFDGLFYPYQQPSFSISVSGGSVREFGNTGSVTLNWSVTSRTRPIQFAQISRPLDNVVGVIGSSFSGAISGSITSRINPNVNNTFTFSVNDNVTYNTTTQLSFQLRRYWGTVPTGSSLSVVSNDTIPYSQVQLLNSELTTTNSYPMVKTISASQSFQVVFVIPTSHGINLKDSSKIQVGVINNTNWTLTRSGINLINNFSYSDNYDVWVLNDPGPHSFVYTINK